MKKLIIILALFLIGCQTNKYEMIMTTEMLDSYVGKKHIPELRKEFKEMGIYGGWQHAWQPDYKYTGYVDSTYCEIYFTTDSRNLILSYSIVKG